MKIQNKQSCHVTLAIPGSPVPFNGAPGNIHGNLDRYEFRAQLERPRTEVITHGVKIVMYVSNNATRESLN